MPGYEYFTVILDQHANMYCLLYVQAILKGALTLRSDRCGCRAHGLHDMCCGVSLSFPLKSAHGCGPLGEGPAVGCCQLSEEPLWEEPRLERRPPGL